MRIALISDIHGHAITLEAVLNDIKREAADQIVCLGDVATIGGQPRQTLDILKSLNGPCILGNHDAALLQPDRAAGYLIAPEVMPNLHWCAQQLSAEDFDFLHTFQPLLEISLGGDDTMLCFHGSPQSNTDLIVAMSEPGILDRLLAGRRATVMVGGHSHVQMVRLHDGMFILNPGSVGSPHRVAYTAGKPPILNPWAEYAIVTWQAGVLSVDCRRVQFDLTAAREAIIASDVPNKAWWLEQYQ